MSSTTRRIAIDQDWPFDKIQEAGLKGARAQQKKFQDYVAENDPSLAARLAAEAARFDVLSRTVIEPTMHSLAEEAASHGWQLAVVRDSDLDRLSLYGTPGVRFYGGELLFRTLDGDLIWPSTFVAFYGCGRTSVVRIRFELAGHTEESCLAYPQMSREAVRALLVTFLERLPRLGSEAANA